MELAFRARLPGPIHLQTRRAQPGDDSDNGAARQNTQQKRGCHYHGAHPVLTPYTGQPLCASLTDSDLLTPSAKVQTPRRTCHPKLIGHSLRPAAQLRPKIGCHPADSDQTTSNMDPDKARQGAPRPTAYGPRARASMITSQSYRVLSQDTYHRAAGLYKLRHNQSAAHRLGSGDPSGPVYQSRHATSSLVAPPT